MTTQMKAYTQAELQKRLGEPTAVRFTSLVDLAAKRCRLWEERTVLGAAEWAAANRKRAGGPVLGARCLGSTVITDAVLGERAGLASPASFGPADQKKGGEALIDCYTRGKDVVTRWKGLAGAGIGLATALGLAPGVMDFKAAGLEAAGGDREVELEVATPALSRLLIGIDDTDTRESGATWALARKVTEGIEDMAVLSVRVVQLFPGVPTKTTNCVATLVEGAVAPWMKEAVKIEVRDRVEAMSTSGEPGVAFAEGLVFPRWEEIAGFAGRARRGIVSGDDAMDAARAVGAQVALDGRGLIGAVASLGAADMGPEAADLG